ncbi:2-C-methyl-D-erythritol 2,4-cyclodiphosphate synthase [Porphyromonas crevioricanis]|uniref:2-C-methyl-D-erythritol 2,4-cyclodiphosphate synthase n=1 Tax=Porphyromonas crevioricanis TaxID=393921 RepID=A0A2X4PZG6_9PORP|nr:2-C-methyl-D-erythritol 2,4-cyclodiphosphate synthase [Porphyromonas crevioricanis]GAD08117.1 2-C-methyl-D-erythritol 2,4-cyclodiphosphate synthase [Porphyromonas crevioricanis JCM 13913]SQH73709.1 2-C-methyl-D-erythritol 2,4-cyclodiphosphate synthase [Porphyromonas crevioricanis]
MSLNNCLFRIGYGYDVHRLEAGLPLWLGGIEVPHTHGLQGHSDADVLCHAICDALLGAAALGDIGIHFPPSDDTYKGIDSKILLSKVVSLLFEEGYTVINVDATISAQCPKLAPHIPAMRQTLAAILRLEISAVSIKATTTEKLGFEGRQEGISASAVALITRI